MSVILWYYIMILTLADVQKVILRVIFAAEKTDVALEQPHLLPGASMACHQ